RDLDQAEDAQVAAHSQVAGERRRQIGAGLLLLELEVDASHDVDAAAGDAQIDGRGGAELERGFNQLQARGVELQVEEAAAAEDADRQQERMRALRDVEVERRSAVEERQRERRAEADVLEREHADRHRRQRKREAGAHARGQQVEAGAGAEEIRRDRLAQLFDEYQIALELERLGGVELHFDIGLGAAAGHEAELDEVD